MLLKPKSGLQLAAEPVVDKAAGTWRSRIREVGTGPGQLRTPPKATYKGGAAVSLFTGQHVGGDYIKAKAQAGEMGSALYAVALRTPQGLRFQPPDAEDLRALDDAERKLARLRSQWQRDGVIPTELYPEVTTDERPRTYGMTGWADLFSPRQLLAMGVFVEEMRNLRPEIVAAEGEERAAGIELLLAFVLDKLANYNSALSFWHALRGTIANTFDRHDYSFKVTRAEMALPFAGGGIDWAMENVFKAYGELSELPHAAQTQPVTISLGSATSLPQIADGSITAVVVDPPYDDNVQYSELADFFYVWLKRTVGHLYPAWFTSYLCENEEEAVVNVARFRSSSRRGRRGPRDGSVATARELARAHYRRLMAETFAEARRILRDDGVLTVMFTHKKQEAWAALFDALITAGFTITATWPVKTESEYSLHQARKNAAQSTVILVARKRLPGAGTGYFNAEMQREIRERATAAAERLQAEGLNPVDQLVGSFGPAMAVYSRYDAVRTDTGAPVGVEQAIDEASRAVSDWRVGRLAAHGLEGVEPEGRFALLCWGVLGAAEFRYNEAHLLGKAVGIDVDRLVTAGLVTKSGDKVQMLSAAERRRGQPLTAEDAAQLAMTEMDGRRRRRKEDVLKVHPNDAAFRTALDGCHALALRYLEAGEGSGGIGAARALANAQGWRETSAVARLMEALVAAAPEALHHDAGPKSVAAKFPEFRAWHALLRPLFGIAPPDWSVTTPQQLALSLDHTGDDDAEDEAEEDDGSTDE